MWVDFPKEIRIQAVENNTLHSLDAGYSEGDYTHVRVHFLSKNKPKIQS